MIKIDCHLHSWKSKDSSIIPSRYFGKILRAKGLQGIALTDHNSVDAWQHFRALCKDLGLIFIPGAEIQTRDPKRGELLCFFLQEAVKSRNFWEVCDEVRDQGGFVYLAHPFDLIRQNWIKNRKSILVNPKARASLDGVEGINARNLVRSSNTNAITWGRHFGLGMSGGSDAHSILEIGEAFSIFDGISAESLLDDPEDLEELRKMFRSHEVTCGRFSTNPIYIHLFNVVKKYTSGLTQVTDLVKRPLMWSQMLGSLK